MTEARKKRLAINGLGRIGRHVFRKLLALESEKKGVELVAVNDLTDASTLVHLLRFDSVYGRWEEKIEAGEGVIRVGEKEIKVLSQPDPGLLPWKDLGIDVVIESTGRFREYDSAYLHLKAGANVVIISAPSKTPDKVPTFILGANHEQLDLERYRIVDMGSCTTNCLAILLKPLHDRLGIKRGLANTIHGYTNNQRLLDLPHKDLRRARAAALNIVPTSTGAAKTIFKVYPDLRDKLEAIAFRVPVPTVSVLNLLVELEKDISLQELKSIYKEYSEDSLKGILRVEDLPLVSTDYIDDPHSCVVDWELTRKSGNMISLVGWYDNEAGYAQRLAEFSVFVAEKLDLIHR